MKTKLAVVGDIKRTGSVVLAATPLLKKEGIKTGNRLFDIPKRKDIHAVNSSMERDIKTSNLSQDIFPYCLTILHTYDSGMPIRSLGISLSNISIEEGSNRGIKETIVYDEYRGDSKWITGK